MKKLFALLALVLGMVSCQTEPEALGVVVGGEQEVMLSVSLPEGTRANSAEGFNLRNLGDYSIRYILEISYNGNLIRDFKITDSTLATFPVRLAPNRDYTFTVWADLVTETDVENWYDADLYYNTASGLENIYFNNWTPNTEARDAWTATQTVTYTSSNKNIGLELKRPFAKVRVVATDIAEIRKFGIEPTNAVAVYAQEMYTEFDAVAGAAKGETTGKELEFAYTGDGAVDTYDDATGELTVFADYVLVPEDGNVQFSLSVFDNTKGANALIKTNNFNTTIPVVKNKVTTIKGNVLTEGGDLSIDIENGFDTPDADIEIWDGESQTEPEVIEDQTGALVAVVDTPSDLAWLAGYVNGTNNFTAASVAATRATTKINFVLGADIDLGGNEWTPIGNKAHHFDGTFDGNGHTIKGLRVTKIHDNGEQAALFGTMSGHPVIKNFVIDEAYIKYPNDGKDFYASAVAGTIYGFVTFENITVKNSTITGNNKVGAIFAHDGSSNKITINNCHADNCYIASEDLKDGGNVGGLIGLFQTGSAEACEISNSSVKNSTIVGINSKNNGKRANSQFIGGILTKTNTNLVLENCVVENNDFSQTINGTDAVTYVGAFPAQFIGGDRNEQLLGFVVVNGVPVSTAGYEKLANYPNILVKEGNYYVFGVAGLEDLNKYFKANWCGNSTWTPEYNIAADIDATGFTWDGVYLNVGWNGNNGIVLNGNGHTISNLTINNYLLSGTPCGGNDGVRPGLVKDITMKNVTVNGSDHDAAIFWGNCFTNVDFENVTVDGAKIKGGSNVGALVSRTSIEGPNTEIKVNFKNCVVKNSTLEADNTNADPNGASGFIGRTYGNTKLTFEGCSVENNTINNAEGLVGGAVYGYTTWAGNGFYGTGACDTFTNWNGLVIKTVNTADELAAAIKAGGNYLLGADIAMTAATYQNVDVTIDGNGYTISQVEGTTNEFALFDSVTGKLTLKNIVFDGIKGGAVLRTTGAELTMDNITVKNCEHTTPIYGLFRLIGKNTIKNSKFYDNKCISVITFNTEGDDNTDPQLVQNCEFKNNTCSATAVVHYSTGGGATIDSNKFVNNIVNCSNNGATVYMGFTENNVVTNNLFQNNTVNEGSTSSRVAGGVFFGYETEFTGNAFIGNKVTGTNAKGNDVCVSTYYTSIDLSGNYWGGNAPVEDTNYFVQHKSDERVVIINDYLTENPFN
ncbi:MAG: hypothetical protein IKW47_00605 [Alistipes sp.]|nr:hypothetical protein [Alistipes sp.]